MGIPQRLQGTQHRPAKWTGWMRNLGAKMKAWVSEYYAQERSKTNTISLFELSTRKSYVVTNSVDLARIMRLAETGDAESQSRLADYYFTGTHGCRTNMIEAYK